MIDRLCPRRLGDLDPSIRRPAYDRTIAPGVLHFGPGAFHRAHQAVYFDSVLASDARWAISAVSLRGSPSIGALREQDGLYTLTLLDEARPIRVVGSTVELLTRDDQEAIFRRFASPDLRLVTATVTEKGYSRAADGGLDASDPAVRLDLDGRGPASFIGWLVRGLDARRRAGTGGLSVMSCDNLPANSATLRRLVLEMAAALDPALAEWIAREVRFPCTMVDAITPRTDEALRRDVAARLGLLDAEPVHREPFAEWVIEDDFAGERPPLELAGARFVPDVSPFEVAKLRLLNAAHSALAYLGLLRGHQTVADTTRDVPLARFAEAMMRDTVAPTLPPSPELHLDSYIDRILERFRNPGIAHRLDQIAIDGSQKIPIRILATARIVLERGGGVDRLALVVAAWFRCLARVPGNAPAIPDPLAELLARPAAAGDVDQLLGETVVFPPEFAGAAQWREAVRRCFAATATSASLDEALVRIGRN